MNTRRDDLEQVGAGIRAAAREVSAPAGLRTRVNERRAQAGTRWRSRAFLTMAAPAGATLAAGLVLVLGLVLGGEAPVGPTVAEATTIALGPATSPAPPGDPRHPGRLAAAVEVVRFPAWRAIGWRAAGQRQVRLHGRPARTVFYVEAHGRRVGYLIVSGDPLPVPVRIGRWQRAGVRFGVFQRAGATVVTWRSDAHTCVLAGRGVGASELIEMVVSRQHRYSES